jgi:hypothetical protein
MGKISCRNGKRRTALTSGPACYARIISRRTTIRYGQHGPAFEGPAAFARTGAEAVCASVLKWPNARLERLLRRTGKAFRGNADAMESRARCGHLVRVNTKDFVARMLTQVGSAAFAAD